MTPNDDTLYDANLRAGMSEADARWLADRVRAQGKPQSPKATPPHIRGGFLKTRAAVVQPQASARDLETVCAACGLPGFGQQFQAAGMDLAAVRKTLAELEGRKPSKAEATALSMTLLGRQLRRGAAHA